MFLFHNWVKSSDDISKSGQGFAQDKQWSLGDDHVQGVDSGRDKNTLTTSKILVVALFIDQNFPLLIENPVITRLWLQQQIHSL